MAAGPPLARPVAFQISEEAASSEDISWASQGGQAVRGGFSQQTTGMERFQATIRKALSWKRQLGRWGNANERALAGI